jgi:hypothetical protein
VQLTACEGHISPAPRHIIVHPFGYVIGMTPFQTFRHVRPPSTADLSGALAMWCTWWLADQLHPQVWGIVLLPIPLALAVRILVLFSFKWRSNVKHVERLQKSRRYLYFVSIMMLVSVLSLLLLKDERLAQICYTAAIGLFGLVFLAFACFSPNDLKETSSRPDRPLEELVGLYTISNIGLIGLALTSIALIDRADDAIWVFALSIGALFYNYLLRWIAVLWLMSRKDVTE